MKGKHKNRREDYLLIENLVLERENLKNIFRCISFLCIKARGIP